MNATYYLGLDVHQRSSTYCLLDRYGQVVQTRTVRGHWSKLIDELASWQQPIQVIFEASLGYGPIYHRLAKFCQRVVVAHPKKLRWIHRAKQKNDKVDAQKLAKLLYLNEVPAVHVPSIDTRNWRQLIEHRRRQVDKRTKVKNSLKALLRGEGIVKPRHVGGQWSKAGRQWLAELDGLTMAAAMRRDTLLEELAMLEQLIKRVTRQLDELAQQHPGVALLCSIPGVGPRTAEAMLAYIDDPHRFARTKRVGAYFGLIPSQDASGGVNKLGHITKEGPGTVRKLLIQSAWRAVQCCRGMRQRFEQIAQGQKDRRKIAVTAIAHKLARIMQAMLKTGQLYDPGYLATQTSAPGQSTSAGGLET